MSKKQSIIDAAIELFSEKGYEATSIQEITERCGISKGAFYLHFKSKDELILAIVDYIINKFGSIIDRVVRSEVDHKHKLFLYYASIFEFIASQRSFAMIFISENIHQAGHMRNVNQELFRKFSFYDEQFSHSLLSLLESIYGDRISQTKYDLTLCMKGFIKTYSEYILFRDTPVDIVALTQSLVDKTNVMAEHARAVFLRNEADLNHHAHEITIDDIMREITTSIQFANNELERESLHVLREQLISEQPSYAIKQGMLANLMQFPSSRSVALLIQRYEHRKQRHKQQFD
ncbi:TetR/AcrR family transcriptional regulator [Paenibacillus septentrionalis]|uniref:TetR/AcrR family transcriptional regulator n=1 Tax=Paenibacillus septentrionalis TaxID=429342 RepID=A0ABW1V5J6_9BACL